MIRKASLALVILFAGAAGLRAQTTVELKPTKDSKVSGSVSIAAMGKGVHFTGTVTGLTPGKHGFHVHEKGDCSAPDAASAGGHFNPDQKQHGDASAAEKHAGDLGNIEAGADGSAKINLHMNGLTLGTEANSIKGKAIIIHGNPDDFSQPTGNAGPRVACGVIN
jgi:Cu-Zn family superoxide dismutase